MSEHTSLHIHRTEPELCGIQLEAHSVSDKPGRSVGCIWFAEPFWSHTPDCMLCTEFVSYRPA